MDRLPILRRRPRILCLDRDPTKIEATRLRPGGRVVGLTDAIDGAPGTIVGVVREADISTIIEAAHQGWDLVVRLDLRGERRRLVLEDLARLGEMADERTLAGPQQFEPADQELLRHLSCGATIREAAQAVGVSERSAARQLARLRAAVGVSTTIGLVARFVEGAQPSMVRGDRT